MNQIKPQEMLSISKAAKYLGVSIQTLRRWAKDGKLRPSYTSPGKHRYYAKTDLLQFAHDLYESAKLWAGAAASNIPLIENAYCQTSSIFQARLSTFETALRTVPELQANDKFSLIVSIVGEIGDNSFAHNLGKWPDIPGVFFAYDTNRKQVVVADRGVGVLATLRQVRPSLHDDQEALMVAFTERLSSRAPENRGNGLKYVRQVIMQNPITLTFRSGNAVMRLPGLDPKIHVAAADTAISGTLALIEF